MNSEIFIISFLSMIIIFLLLICFLVWQYFFNIYEVDCEVLPEGVFNSVIRIATIPINSLGKRVPFKNIESEFVIIEGNELIQIVEINNMSGKLILKTKDRSGKVIIKIKSNYSLCTTIKEINIQKFLHI